MSGLLAIVVWSSSLFGASTLVPYVVQNINTTPAVAEAAPLSSEVLGDECYFASDTPFPTFWHTNGERAGTYRVDHSSDAAATVWRANVPPMLFPNPLYRPPRALWATDGTTAGTSKLIDGISIASGGVPCGNKRCFSLGDNRLASTDGTPAGTSIFASTQTGVHSFLPFYLAGSGSRMYFSGSDAAHSDCYEFGGPTCGELWTSDGTTLGTRLVADLIPGPQPSGASYLFAWKEKVYFVANVALNPPLTRVFVSDGTAAGTLPLGPPLVFFNDPQFRAAGDFVYFRTSDLQYWRTDGTPEGTIRVRDLAGISEPVHIRDLIAGETGLLFQTDRPENFTSFDTWYWPRNGVPAKLTDSAVQILGIHDRLQRFFYRVSNTSGEKLYVGDSTSGTSVPLINLDGNGNPVDFRNATHVAFFRASNRMWRTDGTLLGTYDLPSQIVRDNSSDPDELTEFGGRLYFTAIGNDGKRALWQSNGTPQSTIAIATDCDPCDQLETAGGRLSFRKSWRLWVRDQAGNMWSESHYGSDAGEILTTPLIVGDAELFVSVRDDRLVLLANRNGANVVLRDFVPGPVQTMVINGRFLLRGGDFLLLSTDGTLAGTETLPAGRVVWLLDAGGRAYFGNGAGAIGATDGTAAGTKEVVALGTSNFFYPDPVAAWHGLMFFRDESFHLWRTSSEPGTVVDLGAVPYLHWTWAFGDDANLYVIGLDIDRRLEVWKTDGTIVGTSRVQTLTGVATELPPFRASDGEVYIPIEGSMGRGLLNMKSGSFRAIPGDFFFPGLDNLSVDDKARMVAAGDHIFFAASVDRIGYELLGLDLNNATTGLQPVIDVAYEGETHVSGSRAALFRLTINGGSPAEPSSVHFEAVDGSGKAGRDYVPVQGDLTFDADSNRELVVPFTASGRGTFGIVLSRATNGVIGHGVAYVAPERRRSSAGH